MDLLGRTIVKWALTSDRGLIDLALSKVSKILLIPKGGKPEFIKAGMPPLRRGLILQYGWQYSAGSEEG